MDDSDPDTDLTQIEHLLQTSEAIRRDGHPRWMVLVGFLHDLGKCLCLYGEPQWGVVGDTFPVGCAWSKDIVFHEYFANNPDRNVPQYQTNPWHRHVAYDHLCNDKDRAMMEWVLKFNQYDLYSKGHAKPDANALKPYYDDLFAEFLPEKLDW